MGHGRSAAILDQVLERRERPLTDLGLTIVALDQHVDMRDMASVLGSLIPPSPEWFLSCV